ncbi:MAG TPA: PQQ-dependent sugar dehydrogenase [Planctomycetota bacterium]|nr:PQQ-dependent sugar dehydrogenase [Planctomycetota bacterium]
MQPVTCLVRSLACTLLASGAATQNPPAGFTYQTMTDNAIARGSSMAFAPDGRLFVCERTTGNIRIFANGALSPAVWATVAVYNSASSEQGLLGIAIDPRFRQNGYVYVYFTTPDHTQNSIGRLQEVGGVGTNFVVLTPNLAIPTGGASIHNGGRLVFGRDGKLYAGTGDRGSSSLAQQLTNWNGKVLRFDVPGLTIPGDNPFPGSPIFSYGHRNQFGLTVHPVTGDVFQTENGNNTTDELNRIQSGGNYGWPTYEGPEPSPNPSTVDPLAWYSPTPDPTGTCFYSGTNYPASYTNAWFFVEYTAGRVRKLDLDATATSVVSQSIFDDLVQAYDIQMGPDGNLWVLHNDTTGVRGGDEIGRYVYVGEANPSLNVMAVSNQSIGASLTFGCHGTNGDLFLAWVSTSVFAPPVPTPFGDQFVPLELIVGFALATADDRAYIAWDVPDDPILDNVTLYAQGARLDAGGVIAATNFDSIVLH